MKPEETKKNRPVSIGGIVVAVLSLIVFLNPGPSANLVTKTATLGAGIALLIRAFRPPLSFGRGLATWFGGGLAGNACLGVWGTIVLFSCGTSGLLREAPIIMMVVGGVLAFFLLRYGFSPVPPPTTEDIAEGQAEAEFKKAIKLETNGKLTEAIEVYERIIKDFPRTSYAKDADACLNTLRKKGEAEGGGTVQPGIE